MISHERLRLGVSESESNSLSLVKGCAEHKERVNARGVGDAQWDVVN